MFIQYSKIKQEYNQETDESYRKRCGQFFTPGYIAEFMVRWVIHNGTKSFLDPALGLGIFFDKLLSILKRDIKLYGYETDSMLIQKTRSLFKNKGKKYFKLYNKDYLSDWGKEYDGIICNPPYIIYKEYNNKLIQKKFTEKLSVTLSGFCNLYIYFLVKSLSELKDKGRMAYILPPEFFNADYGIKAKEIIKSYGYLRYVIILNYRVFDAITTSAILLFANDDSNGKQQVEFFKINNISEFNDILLDVEKGSGKNKTVVEYKGEGKSIFNDKLKPELKWQVYYHISNFKESNNYRYLVKFSKYARVVRGMATGANKFFLFNRSKKERFQIKNKYLLSCLPKASYIDTHFIDFNRLNELRDEDKHIFLLNISPADVDNDKYLVQYICSGKEKGYHRRYLTRHRNPWYVLNLRQAAPVLVKTFNRKGLQFVLNEARVHNLTPFHCIYIKNIEYAVLVKSYLFTDIAGELFSKNRREYGNGLIKYEPNDLNRAYMPDLARIDNDSVKYINIIYETFIEKSKKKRKIDREIEELNTIFRDIFKV